jgi:hypothetical protein
MLPLQFLFLLRFFLDMKAPLLRGVKDKNKKTALVSQAARLFYDD